MKYNLLKMTQLILSSMDGDEINDINDTVESRQVVDIIEQTFNHIVSHIDFPEHWDFFELQPSNDLTRPTLMYLPANVARLEWVQYDRSPNGSTTRDWGYVLPMARKTFFNRMNGLDTTDDTVYQYNLMVGAETFDVRGKKNTMPSYFTTPDNRTLIFDSYDADNSHTLVGNRTQAYGQIIPTFQRSNTFTPDLEPKQFSLFFNEAKSQCFLDLKMVENTKAERRARRGWVSAARKKENTKASQIKDWMPNYGRKNTK